MFEMAPQLMGKNEDIMKTSSAVNRLILSCNL